ncbi:MAG: biopolymer transporter ExbD [Cytophagales bacterium]|nr:biopolymer transporter ExbD [Cytophagales bacterium]
MASFKKKTKTSQEIPTSALPDIIFILLFFFMVATTVRPNEVKVKTSLPRITQVQKLEQVNILSNIHIGKPNDVEKFGKEARIQVNDVFISADGIPKFIEEERVKLGDKRNLLQVVFKIDKEAKMGLVTDVQEKLRDVSARKVNYSGLKISER